MSKIIHLEVLFDIGDHVYLKTDEDQRERIVEQIRICPNSCIMYSLACGTESTEHYGMEISAERDIIKSTSE